MFLAWCLCKLEINMHLFQKRLNISFNAYLFFQTLAYELVSRDNLCKSVSSLYSQVSHQGRHPPFPPRGWAWSFSKF